MRLGNQARGNWGCEKHRQVQYRERRPPVAQDVIGAECEQHLHRLQRDARSACRAQDVSLGAVEQEGPLEKALSETARREGEAV